MSGIQSFRPPSFLDLKARLETDAPGVQRDIDQAYQVAYQRLDQQSAQLNGMKNGATSITGSRLRLSTGLSSVSNVVCSLQGSTAVNEWVTFSLNADGSVNLYVWKPTSNVDNTPIASTTARTVSWVAWGAE